MVCRSFDFWKLLSFFLVLSVPYVQFCGWFMGLKKTVQLYIACPQNANKIKSFFKSLQTSSYFWVKYATVCMIASDCNLRLHRSAVCVCKLLSVHRWTIHISFQIILSLARECPGVGRWWHWVSGWRLWFLYLLPQAGLQPAFLPLSQK